MLAAGQGASAHLRPTGVKASTCVGIAGIDPMFSAEEEGRLASALRAAAVDHTLETYAGAAHGFTMSDLPVFRPAAAQRHRDQLRTRLGTALQ